MMMVGVMMIPRRVMPGMVPVVDAVMMREGVISPPMVGRARGRMGVCMVGVPMMPVPAVPMRSMSGMSMPAMSALGEGRNSIGQQKSDHHRQTQQTKRSHDLGPLI